MGPISSRSKDPRLPIAGLRPSRPLEVGLRTVEGACEERNGEFFCRALERAGISPENALHLAGRPLHGYGGMDALLVGPDDRGSHLHAAVLFDASNPPSEHQL